MFPFEQRRILLETARSFNEECVSMANLSDVKSDYEESWKEAQSNYSDYWDTANLALRAGLGESLLPKEVLALKEQKREPSELNIIRPNINWFSGYMRDNFKNVIAGPREEQDQLTADEISQVMTYVHDKGNYQYAGLSAFDHCLYSGLALWGMYLDYTRDSVNGDIRYYKRSYNSFAMSPNWQNLDLSDCPYVIIRDFLSRDEAKASLPFIDPEVIDHVPSFFSDDKFSFLRPRENIKFTKRDLISFDSFYQQTTRRVNVIIDLDTGEEREVREKDIDLEQLKQAIAFENSQGSNLDLIEKDKPSVQYNIILSGEPVFSGRDPLNIDSYPCVPVVCYFNSEISEMRLRYQSIAHAMRDVQRMINKRHMAIFDYFSTIINGGMFYKPSKLTNSKSVWQSGNSRNIPVREDATQNDFWPILQNPLPPGTFEYLQQLQQLPTLLAGVNDSVFGRDEGGNTQVSGHLAEVRVANGLRANRAIFDNFERSQKILGSKTIESIQNTFSLEKITRILGKEPTDKFKMRSFERFDCAIKLSVNSQTQKDAYYFELLRLRELLGPEAVTNSDIVSALPMVDKSEYLKKVEEREQAQAQQAQKVQEMEMILKEMQLERLNGEKILNELRQMREVKEGALTRVKISEVEENMANATLDRAKAFTEIQKLSDERIMTILNFIQNIEERDRANRDVEVQKTISDVSQITQQDAAINQGVTNG